jgi:hypothetical protein
MTSTRRNPGVENTVESRKKERTRVKTEQTSHRFAGKEAGYPS